jgi:putative ABC transport system permease protein
MSTPTPTSASRVTGAPMSRLLGPVLAMALGSMRAHRLRSLLTTLGVVIGVATVVAMASIIQGFNHSIQSSIASFGSHTIYVRKFAPGFFAGGFPDSLARRKAFTADDAEAIRRLCPDVAHVAIIGFIEDGRVRHRGKSTRRLQVIGSNPSIQEVNIYDPWIGRFFTEEEVRRRAQVMVIGKDVRDALFTGEHFIGKTVHLNGIPFTLVGELEPRGRSLFGNANELVTIPYTTLEKYFPPSPDAPFWVPQRGEYYLNVRAASAERQGAALDQIREVLRRRRGLSENEADDFAVFTSEALTKLYDQLTGATYVVITLISSVALMVGGIGVMNIMLVAVTERTKEIGLRKALGAPRFSILLQFLVEAASLCAIGGVIGIALGAGVGQLVRAVSPLPAYTPLWAVVLAFVFSVAVGIFFGLYPATRASRLDPVEALRWE